MGSDPFLVLLPALAEGALLDTQSGHAALHASQSEVAVAFDIDRDRVVVPVYRDGLVCSSRVALQTHEEAIRRRHGRGQADVGHHVRVGLAGEHDLLDSAQRVTAFPERPHVERHPFLRRHPDERFDPAPQPTPPGTDIATVVRHRVRHRLHRVAVGQGRRVGHFVLGLGLGRV